MPALILLLIFLIIPKISFAQTPSPSDPTPTVDLINLQKIRKAVQDKVEEKLDEINNSDSTSSTTKKAIVGKTLSISEDKIKINYSNQDKEIIVDEDTTYIDSKRSKTKLSALKEGQMILALGYAKDNSFAGKRVIFIDAKDAEQSTLTITGIITDISPSTSIIALSPFKNKDLQYQLKTSTLVNITNLSGKTIDFKNLTKGQKIAVIVKNDTSKKNIFNTNKILVLTSDPVTSPTPSVKNTPTPKPTKTP